MFRPADTPFPSPRQQRRVRAAAKALLAGCIAAAAVAAALPAFAAETVTYQYDARGRLIEVKRVTSGSGAPAPSTTAYQFDKANNRTVKTTSSP
ncbi:MAG TPA: hypothetical protein VGB70_01295 [Allosphingosinicella sp.]|jgi:N-acetyl-gamma-glutamylphosphate reductase